MQHSQHLPNPPPIKSVVAAAPKPPVDALQVGNGTDLFTITIRVISSSCLNSIPKAPSNIILDKKGAWFSYSFLGVVVQTERFWGLGEGEAIFPDVADSFKLRGSLDEMKAYLKSSPPLAFYLAGNASILGSACIPLAPLISSVNFSGQSVIGGSWSITKETGTVSRIVPKGGGEASLELSIALEQITSNSQPLPNSSREAAIAASEVQHQQQIASLQKKIANLSEKQVTTAAAKSTVSFQKSPVFESAPAGRMVEAMVGSGVGDAQNLEKKRVERELEEMKRQQAAAQQQHEAEMQQMRQQVDAAAVQQQQHQQQQQQQQREQVPFANVEITPTSIDLDDVDDDEDLSNRLDGIRLEVVYDGNTVGSSANVTEIGDYGEVNVTNMPASDVIKVDVFSECDSLSMRCVTTHDKGVIGIVSIPLETIAMNKSQREFDIVSTGEDGGVIGKVGVDFIRRDLGKYAKDVVGGGGEVAPLAIDNYSAAVIASPTKTKSYDGRHIYRFSIETRSLEVTGTTLADDDVIISHLATQLGATRPYSTSAFRAASSGVTTIPKGKGSTIVYEFVASPNFVNGLKPIEVGVSNAKGVKLGSGFLSVAEVLPESRMNKPTFIRDKKTNKTFYSVSDFQSAIGGGGNPIFVYASEVVVELGGVGKLNCAVILEDIGVDETMGREGSGDLVDPLSSPLELDQTNNNSMLNMDSSFVVDNSRVTPGANNLAVNQLNNSTAAIAAAAAAADIERRRREWEEWRHREEVAWHERLRAKEEASLRAVENSAKLREREKNEAIAHAQAEYAKLEGRLRKALLEVETRERKLKADEVQRAVEHTQKMQEIQMMSRRGREEAKFQVDLEKQKTAAALERAEIADKARVVAEKRCAEAENEFTHYRQQQRKSPESVLLQELATLKGKLSDSESRINKERAERNAALLEKEQFRAHIHRLARALRREREKTASAARRDLEQLRLEYVAKEQKFVLDGDRNELRKIKEELKMLNDIDRRGTEVGGGGGGRGVESVWKMRGEIGVNTSTNFGDVGYEGPQTPPTKVKPVAEIKVNSPIVEKKSSNYNSKLIIEHEQEVERLENEKRSLLETGVFDVDSEVIIELDRLYNIASFKLSEARSMGGGGVVQ